MLYSKIGCTIDKRTEIVCLKAGIAIALNKLYIIMQKINHYGRIKVDSKATVIKKTK